LIYYNITRQKQWDSN